MTSYEQFLAGKSLTMPAVGIADPPALGAHLYEFQRDIVRWALRRGRAAIFADCGMGKTLMQLEWARHVPGRVLILAPLAVNLQTVREGARFGIEVIPCRSRADIGDGINIANYEMLEHFDAESFEGVVLDESSILKSFDGKTRSRLIRAFRQTPFRLACTATPAPNDHMELGNHAEFLGAMTRSEMLSMFFCHDGGDTQSWRIKRHAKDAFWRWVCSWAVTVRKPSDLGYDDGGFVLPPLSVEQIEVSAGNALPGMLFRLPAESLPERIAARRQTVKERVDACVELVRREPKEQWLIWCGLNSESQAITKALRDLGAVEVSGSDKTAEKEANLLGFATGDRRVLITKPSIAGHGMNFQSCARVAFVGLSDSWEDYYQAVRRCWRFGQMRPVQVYIVTADIEGAVVENIKRKERDAATMAEEMAKNMRDINSAEVHGGTDRKRDEFKKAHKGGAGWDLYLDDCVDRVRALESESVAYTIFSPPFASLYTYSASERDMGNCKDDDQFFRHFGEFLVPELFRVTAPGRLLSFHCMNLPTSKARDGYIGVRDFRGELIRMFVAAGWIFHSEVCIWKDPVTAMQRTKALGLLHKQIKKDSCMSRQGIPDYLVTMRKPGENAAPVSHTAAEFPVTLWQRYASPVWMDINPSDTLQHRSARAEEDERHICPLQLEVIRRAMLLWSKEGDLVLSPFAGIGSEGYVALQMGRRFVGVELKESYWQQAAKNLANAKRLQPTLFDAQVGS